MKNFLDSDNYQNLTSLCQKKCVVRTGRVLKSICFKFGRCPTNMLEDNGKKKFFFQILLSLHASSNFYTAPERLSSVEYD